ncbi:MAG: hypothetical protein AABW52_02630 [Nanoarchaeota archaeon]
MAKLTACEIFSRERLKGDMLSLFKNMRKPIPVDFVLLDSNETLEELSYLRKDAEKLRSIKSEMIQEAVDSVNNVYSRYANGRLNFKLGRIEKYFISYGDGTKFPGDNSATADRFIVRVNPLIYGGHCGQYYNYGFIEVLPEAIIEKFNHKIIAHEIGHGIFGHGHHTPEIGCLMDESWFYQSDRLCEEDTRTLELALI